jgi:putative glutamine amidotransferase
MDANFEETRSSKPKAGRTGIKAMIGVPSSLMNMPAGRMNVHGAAERYIDVLVELCDCIPILIPAIGDQLDYRDMASRLDGIMLTGGRANIEPHHFGGTPFPPDEPIDPGRDATVIGLIRAGIEAEVPIFGSCRGIQEMNVALGGSLHYRVHMLDGKLDHRMPRGEDVPREEIFKLRHRIEMAENSLFAELAGTTEVMVNSLHAQAVDRLAPDLEVVAVSTDGVIEGVRLKNDTTFTVGVQWHAEHEPEVHQLSRRLFEEFGVAAHKRARARRL